jgi:competence protein ComFB
MGCHNINEEIVIAEVNAVFDFIDKNGNPEKICSCTQCRTDTICYVLNRIKPHYVVSNRGIARIERESLEYQQKEADIAALVYEGIKQVHHRMRPFLGHYTQANDIPQVSSKPVFNLPIIKGRIFNGLNFAPMDSVAVELWYGKKLAPMIDNNWQNPYNLVTQTMGVFTFWPYPLSANSVGIHKKVGFSIKVIKPGFEELYHCFVISVVSELKRINTFSMERVIKLPDLYMFPPEEEANDQLLADC